METKFLEMLDALDKEVAEGLEKGILGHYKDKKVDESFFGTVKVNTMINVLDNKETSSLQNPYANIENEIMNKFSNEDIDDAGVDLDELSLKQTSISKKEVEDALSDLDRIIAKTKDSEEGIDLDLLEHREEQRKTIIRKLQEKNLENNELERKKEQEFQKLYEEEIKFAKKRFEDCSSEELNKRTDEELERKKKDDEIYHYVKPLLQDLPKVNDLYKAVTFEPTFADDVVEWKQISIPNLLNFEVLESHIVLNKEEK